MARMRTQPQGAVIIDWSNPITQGLVFAFSHNASGANGFSVNGNTQQAYSAVTPISTPMGLGVRSNSATSRAYSIMGHGLYTTNYSLFAVCTAATTGNTMNVIDMDNSGPRYFQFRLAGNKADFIPFNNNTASPAVTGQVTIASGLSLAELNKGFTMGATASPTRTAVFQNKQMATAVPTNLGAPKNDLPVSIGCRAAGTAGGWTSGGINMVAGWNRTLSDAEMISLADNPWQLFLGWDDSDIDYFSIAAGGGQNYQYTGSGGLITSGSSMVQRIKDAVASGLVAFAGQATKATNISRTVVSSGGLYLGGVATRATQALRDSLGGIGVAGAAYVISQAAGQTAEVFGALNDVICQKLKALGNVGALRDMLNENKYWRNLTGNNTKPINDVKKEYLKSQGHTGSVNEMEKQYWKNK